jgi:hypothetical protein
VLKLLVVVVVICVLVYAVVRIIDRRLTSAPRFTSPDDDPDFLRGLDRRRWEEKRRREHGTAREPGEPGEPDPQADDG